MANNSETFRSFLNKIVESLGFDTIPYAIGFAEFKAIAPFEPSRFSEIKTRVDDIVGEKLVDALSFSKDILSAENDRGDKIENKAYSLIGTTGISTAFVTGITSLLANSSATSVFWVIIVLYILIVLALTFTVLLASRVVIVGKYQYAYPDISDVFNMGSQALDTAQKDRLASYVYCYTKNFQIHNIKASYLTASQIWFRNAIILFLFLASMLVIGGFQNTDTTGILPSVTSSATAVVASPSSTVTLKPTSVNTLTTRQVVTSTLSAQLTQTPKISSTSISITLTQVATPTP